MKEWIDHEREFQGLPNPEEGCDLGPWEPTSTPLVVSEQYKTLFAQFRTHLQAEEDTLGDQGLQRGIDLLEKRMDYLSPISQRPRSSREDSICALRKF